MPEVGIRRVDHPGVKVDIHPGAKELDDAEASEFRSLTMTGAYIRFDRPEISYSIKELPRHMVHPTDIGCKHRNDSNGTY